MTMNSSTKLKRSVKSEPVLAKGWTALVRKLGKEDATRFIRMFSTGTGDSVKEAHDFWRGMSIDDIDTIVRNSMR